MPTRVHIVALPHTLVTRDYDWCAYTAKIRRFTRMVADAGHTPILYGPDVTDVDSRTTLIPIVTEEDRVAWFGAPEWDRNRVFDQWDRVAPHWTQMNARAATAIAANWQPHDIVGLIGGHCQRQVLDELREKGLEPMAWEWGIGYSGVLPESHKTYESYAWAHHVAATQGGDDIRFFDSVIPNCFEPEEFEPSLEVGSYLLFMGRPTARKGLSIVQEIAQRTDIPVKVAGQPGADIRGAEYVGLVTGQAKKELLAGALAVLTPTTYLEPFGGVAVEAMLSGTPVISTDWGAFTETVVPYISGLRCRTLSEFLHAVKVVHHIDRRDVLGHAQARYTTDVGARLYGQQIDRLLTLHGGGWYQLKPGQL